MDLSLQRLQSLHAVQRGSHVKPNTKFAKGGLSKTRCQKILQNPPCSCKCSMPLRILIMICEAFWHLCKGGQDSLLWSIQKEAGPGKKRWALQGHPLCKDAWVAFLGIGKQRLNRCKHTFHGRDLRTISGPGGSSPKLLIICNMIT